MSCAIGPNLIRLMRLIVVTTPGKEGRGHEEIARSAVAGGCRAVQFRDKEMPDREFARTARSLKKICREAHALFFVNDRVDIAADVGCDGVHLGVEDLDVASARKKMPPGAMIGFSPESIEGARAAAADGADYLGIGPVFSSPTKPDAGRPIGLSGLAEYCTARIAPVIAVGGIGVENAASAIRAGADGVAVVSAVAAASNMEGTVGEILAEVEAAGSARMSDEP